MNLRLWFRRKVLGLDYKFLLPALERAADKKELTGAERKAAIARAWELHEELEKKRTK